MDLFLAISPAAKNDLAQTLKDPQGSALRVELAHQEALRKLVEDWAVENGGTLVGPVDQAIVAQFPGANVLSLRNLKEKYEKFSGKSSIGVGLTPETALKALKKSPEFAGTTFYTETLNNLKKAEGEVPQGNNFHEDLHRHADGHKNDQIDAQKLKETKQAVIQALQGIQSQKPVLEALKQQAPELHQHILSLTQRIVELAGHLPRIKKSDQDGLKLIHYGKPGINNVDPSYMGTGGTPSQEYKQGLPEIPRSYWYRDGSQPEHTVARNGRERYSTTLFNPKLYDLSEDEQGLGPKARERHLSGKGKWTFGDTYLDEIKNAGYHGYYNSRSQLPHVVALFHTQPVQPAPLLPLISEPMAKSEVNKSPSQRIVDAISDQFPEHKCQNGDCYYSTEALYHLLGGKQAGWEPHTESGHWYLRSKGGKTVDATSMEPKNGRPKKLLTENPSKQALKIIDKVLMSSPVKKSLPKLPGATKFKQFHTAPGTIKGRKIKVQHADGTTSWKEVGAGMIQGQEAGAPNMGANSHPVSAREPNSK